MSVAGLIAVRAKNSAKRLDDERAVGDAEDSLVSTVRRLAAVRFPIASAKSATPPMTFGHGPQEEITGARKAPADTVAMP